jgi:hypothetical protein
MRRSDNLKECNTMTNEWHYIQDGQPQGPVTSMQLHQFAAAGRLKGTDLVWKEGMAEWTPASAMEFLATAIVGRIPQPPPAIPARPKAVPPPRPAGQVPQPASTPTTATEPASATPAGQDALAALAQFSNRAKSAGRTAASRVKRANSAIPNQIKVGGVSVPKWAAIGGAALLIVVIARLIFGGTPHLSAEKLQAAYSGVKWDKGGPYDEKLIEVSGTVSETHYDSEKDVFYVALRTQTDHEVMCIFKGMNSGGVDLNRLSSGDVVSVKGKCMGLNLAGGVVVEQSEMLAAPAQK